jgi:magnesium-transporting ATPase (P-type)
MSFGQIANALVSLLTFLIFLSRLFLCTQNRAGNVLVLSLEKGKPKILGSSDKSANGVQVATKFSPAFYLMWQDSNSPAVAGVILFFLAMILFQNLVPISLYISIEFMKTTQVC